MSRRSGYAPSEIYEERERDYYAPSRDRGARTTEYEELDVRERRRPAEREPPEFLREDYGRHEAGPLVLRDGKRDSIEYRSSTRERSRERPRRREVIEEDVVLERDRPKRREIVEEEVSYRAKSRGPPIATEREEMVYRPREREREIVPMPPPALRSEREEFVFRPKIREPSPEPERTEISIREREVERPRRREYREEDEEIIIRRGERERERPRERPRFEEEEIIIREKDRERLRPRAASYERESLSVRSDVGERPRARSRVDARETDIVIRRDESRPRAKSRGDIREEDIVIRRGGAERERERPRAPPPREPSRERDYEDIIFRHDDNGRRHNDEIIIRRNERSPSPEPAPEPPREPEPIRAPPLHQEIITHHRHIDHGFERAPESPRPAPPPRPRTPSPVRDERIEIRHSGTRNGRHYDDDIVFERETGARRHLEGVRRSERPPPEPEYEYDTTITDTRDRGRRFEAKTSKNDRVWTEITKDLISEESIKEVGYEYEQNEKFYYVMEFLHYEDVLRLTELTDEIRDARRDRIREIQIEREVGPEPKPRRQLAIGAPGGWDEERIVERERIVYEPERRRGYR